MPQVLVAAKFAADAVSLDKAHDASVDQRRANAMQRTTQRAEAAKQRMDQLQRARAARAAAINMSEQLGTGDSSAVSATTSSITTAAADNISQISTALNTAEQIGSALSDAAKDQEAAAVFGAASNVLGVFADATGAYDKVFGTDNKAPKKAKKESRGKLSPRPDPWNTGRPQL